MTKVFGIVGWSGSGKTDIVCRLIDYYRKKNICVSSVKHTHHNFDIDKKGKDSFKQMISGSNEVVIYNEKKWAMVSALQKKKIKLEEILDKFSKKTEIILVEGLKTSKFPKIEVYYSKIKKPLLFPNDKNIKAVVSDKITKDLDSCKIPKLEFCNTKTIGDFIINYFRNEK
tara:strand:- start:1650 stop:2162 length:513 start_codon:yes stop_codon:yes gene_type:complete